MSNGLLNSGGFTASQQWDMNNNIDPLFDNDEQTTNSNSNSKLKPYKNQINSNPFNGDPISNNQPDTDYINPFIDFTSSQKQQESQHHNNK